MIRFCIDRSLIGSYRHLIYDEGEISFSDDVPLSCWYMNGSLKDANCLDTLFRLEHVSVDFSPPQPFFRSMQIVVPDVQNIPWADVMPKDVYCEYIKNIVNLVAETITNISQNYYMGTWVPSSAIFNELRPACVDKSAWLKLVRAEKNATNRSTLESFMPVSEQFMRLVKYDRMKTRTGRLSVASGPNILTIKKDYRKIIRSRYGDDGTILYVDFAALEARVILHESGRWFNTPDLYSELAMNVFGGRFNRAVIKAAVIQEMYGISAKRLSEILQLSETDTATFISTIRTYFNVDTLLKKLKNEFSRKGFVKNHYGRKVSIDDPLDRIIINSYVQSTGVDVSLLGFSNYVKKLKKTFPTVVPIFLLHDALLLDVHKRDVEEIKKHNTVKVKGYVQRWWLHIEEL